jgi:Fe-S-cluster containining protein
VSPVSRKKKVKKQQARARGDARRGADGRLHLVLHRDPVSGAEGVALARPVFDEPWQNDLAAGAANTARGVLRDAPSVERAVALAAHVMAATSRLTEGLLARAPEGAVACRAGCDHCCYQSVGVTPPEALAIRDHLQKTRSATELAAVAAHVGERHARTRGLTSNERFSPDYPCPFLREGRCSIYEVRPLACRGMNSLDAGECATRLRDPAARAAFLADGSAGHSFLEPIRAVHAVSAGIQLGLSELYDLDMRPLELTAAMDLLLNGPASGPDDWVAGQRPFESAVRGDWSADPNLRRLSGAAKPSAR